MSPTSNRQKSGDIRDDDDENEPRNQRILNAVVLAYAAVGGGLLLLAEHIHGPLRVVLTVLGTIGVGFLALWISALLLFGLGWGFFTGTFRRQPSILQRIAWLLAAIVAGALIGATSYASGLAGVISGPLLLAVVIAVSVGLTIFI